MAYALIGREDIAATAAAAAGPAPQEASPGAPPTPAASAEAPPAGRAPGGSKRARQGQEPAGARAPERAGVAAAAGPALPWHAKRQRRPAPQLVLPYMRRLHLPAYATGPPAGAPGTPPGGQQQHGGGGAGAGDGAGAVGGEGGDGMDGLGQALHQLRFGRDDRLTTVRQLMGSASPQPLKVGSGDGP
jgi:hypothetical protein